MIGRLEEERDRLAGLERLRIRERDLALREVERLKGMWGTEMRDNDLYRTELPIWKRRAEAAEERAGVAEKNYQDAMLFVVSFRDCERCADAVKTCDHWKGVEWAMFDRAHLKSVKKVK
jgi:hypothetical protein